MSKKYILLFTIIWFTFQPFETVHAALRTKVRICAVKGSVQTGPVLGDGITCPLKQSLDQTECRVVNQATMIETGPDGWANIEYANGRKVRIMPNTKVVLERDIIYVHSGSSWFKVEVRGSDQLHIKTPTAIAGIRGTEFVVNVEKDGSSNFQLIEGSIEISDTKKKSNMMLAAGMKVEIPAGSSTLNTGLLNIKENDKWWTDWPTLIPIVEMPGNTGGTISSNTSGNTLSPIADSHVYAYSYSNWNKANWGKYNILGAGWNPTGGEKRAYLKFDISGVDKSTFEKASLKLFHYHTAGSNSAELGVYTVRNPWNEGNGNYKPANIAALGEVCWISQPQSDQYPVAYFNPGTQTNDFVEVDITALVKSWLEGMPNHGLVIKTGENYLNGPESVYGFYAREHEEASKRPVLVLNGSGMSSGISKPSTNSLPIFEDFNSGLGNWEIGDSNAGISEGKLFFHTGNSLLGVFNKQVPMENIEIEFDGYTETNGINVYLHNDKNEGYIVFMGGWFNAQSGSDVGKVNENRELIQGKVWEPKHWHHYKVIKCGNLLETYCDGSKIYSRTVSTKFSGKGKIKFSSWNTRIGIDNIKVSNCSTSINNSAQGNLSVPVIAGKWELTCPQAELYIFNLNITQSGNKFEGSMVCSNRSNPNTIIEGQIFSDGSLEFVRSTGNWKQYYTGEINQKSGSRATSFEGMFGFKDQLNYEWYAKAINGLSSNNRIAGNWLIDQSNGYNGSMTLQQNNSGRITGNAIWNGYLKGTISGKVSGNAIEFTISYPSGDKGLYKGSLTQNGIRMINGTVVGNNGVTATWEANR